MGVQEIRFDIAQHVDRTQREESSQEASANLLNQIKKNISAKAEGQKEARSGKAATSGERAASKFQAQFGGLLGGSQGADKQKAAATFNGSPIFQGANAQAKETVTEKIVQGQLGFDTASQFEKDTTHPLAHQALITAEAKGMVVQTYAEKKNLEKMGNALGEFFPAFADQDPKVQKGALRLTLEHPGSEAAKTLNKGIGNQSLNGKQLNAGAKEALINLAQRSDKSNPADLKKALDFVNDPAFAKKMGDGKFAGVLSDFSKMTAKKPAVADDVAVFLKQYDKINNMSGDALRQCGQLIAMRGGAQGLTGKGSSPLAGALPDALKMARTESRQKAALRKLMENSGDISEEELREAMTPKRRIDLSIFNDKEPGTPDYQSQLNLLKQKAGNLNKKVLQQVNNAKSRQGLARIEAFINPAREFTNGITDAKQLAELRSCSVAHAEAMIKVDGELEAQLKPMRTSLSKKQRELRKVNESPEQLRERPPLKAKPNKTTFTLPNNADGTSNVAVFADFLRESVASTTAAAAAGAATTTAAPAQAGKVVAQATKSYGNYNFQLGIDRDRQFFGGKAVKEPPKKEEKKAAVTKTVHANVAAKNGQTLIKANTEFRPVGQMIEDGQFPTAPAERAVLRNLGVTRNVFDSWVQALAKRTQPIIPNEFFTSYDKLPDHKQKTVELGGWSKDTWNANVARLQGLRDTAVGAVAGRTERSLTGGKTPTGRANVGMKGGA